MNYYIYETTNLINGRKYIGKRQTEKPILKDKYLGSGKILKQALLIYGKDNFKKEIIEICDSKEMLDLREKEIILERNAIEDYTYYNIHEGGSGGNTVKGLTDDERAARNKKLSDAHKKRLEMMTPEEREKEHIFRQKIGKMGADKFIASGGHTEEWKAELRKRFSGEKNPMYGVKLSEERKRYLKEHNLICVAPLKGKKLTDEQRKVISDGVKKSWEKRRSQSTIENLNKDE